MTDVLAEAYNWSYYLKNNNIYWKKLPTIIPKLRELETNMYMSITSKSRGSSAFYHLISLSDCDAFLHLMIWPLDIRDDSSLIKGNEVHISDLCITATGGVKGVKVLMHRNPSWLQHFEIYILEGVEKKKNRNYPFFMSKPSQKWKYLYFRKCWTFPDAGTSPTANMLSEIY